MKKIILTVLLSSTYIFANINAVVSILPEQTFVKAIGGEKVNISLMVTPGSSPHTYEPKPSQMLAVSKADLYFAIGVEFENVWLPKFKNLNPHLAFVDLSEGIEKLPMLSAAHTCSSTHEAHEHHEHASSEGKKDPHIWTSPANVKRIARHIYEALSKHDPSNIKYYKENLEAFVKTIELTDQRLKKMFDTYKGPRTFMVFHPSWGYFAKDYGLEQIAVEIEGKSPKPRELVALIKKAKEKQVSAIFTQPEFSDASAKIIASELGIPVVKSSPMAQDWSDNLIRMAQTITGNL